MIEAVLFALGLVTGPFHVVVQFESPSAGIEILLDGEVVAEVAEPPWEASFDLGDELTPHELVVVSRDAAGGELDRVTRWLNVGTNGLDVEHRATPVVVLLDDRRTVPEGLEGWFVVDGQAAEVVDLTYPDAEIWVVRDPKAQLELDRASRLAFAGAMGFGEIPTHILRSGPDATFEYLSQDAHFILHGQHRFHWAWDNWHQLFTFEEGTEFRLVSPWGAPVSQIEKPRLIFGATRPVEMHSSGLLHHAYVTRPLTSWFRLADATGIAGLQAARDRRRAVVVLTADPNFPDDSLYGPSQIRSLLAELGVPLFVWYIGHGDPNAVSDWGPARFAAPSIGDAGSMEGEPGGGHLRALEFEFTQVARTLDRQRIVWIRGRHLPTEISLRPAAEGVRLVSSVDSWPLVEQDLPAPGEPQDSETVLVSEEAAP